MGNSKSSTERCPHCHVSGSASSKIRDKVMTRCRRNRTGTCAGCQKLLDIECKIEETRRTLDNLLKEKEALASTLNEHHDPLSYRLPVEITSRIFLQSLPLSSADVETHYSWDYDAKSFIKSVLLLGHVSKYWRKVARGTPKIWSILCLMVNRSNCLNTVLFMREWLELSGGLPLCIQLRVERKQNDVVTAVLQKVVVSLIEHAHRWKMIDFDIPHYLLPWVSSAMPIQQLSCLEHIELGVTSTHSDDLDATSVLSLRASPRWLTQGNIRLSQISINMEHLTHFYSRGSIEMDDCIQLFRDAPRLLTCDIQEVTGHASSNVLVTSPSLQTLKTGELPENWWNSLTLLSLEELTVDEPIDESWMQLHSLLQRSGCKLKVFNIVDTDPNPDMLEVLELTPHLQQLDLYGGIIREPLFSMMNAAASSTPNFLRNLTSLILYVSENAFDWTWLLVFLTTMTTRPESSLRVVIFTYLEPLCDEPIPGTLRDKKTFNLVLDILRNVELSVLDTENADLVELLRNYHKL
ncbi:hypothetical protein CPB83DRAFT_907952 [Crepidotus variabilis]|uniref:F-box domain-containing protein n=1 Tax=Crepidotus variabilis TaxID=179855 RepID=A0A9P6ECZ7_9AGAR|nr:hypothetical protein CPB83DRAFT_907952 [Crepidotus variabilis]